MKSPLALAHVTAIGTPSLGGYESASPATVKFPVLVFNLQEIDMRVLNDGLV